ncbi:FAD-linked oxidase C-terminal domain-containing protein [Actinoallomurus purpureus]
MATPTSQNFGNQFRIEESAVHRAIRSALDPAGILNPGKAL